MSPGWLRRRRSPDRKAAPQPTPPSLTGYPILLRRLNDEQEGGDLLDALGKRYELSPIEGEGLHFRVLVDDAYDPDEAVVRLASALDEIHLGWEDHFAWPSTLP